MTMQQSCAKPPTSNLLVLGAQGIGCTLLETGALAVADLVVLLFLRLGGAGSVGWFGCTAAAAAALRFGAIIQS